MKWNRANPPYPQNGETTVYKWNVARQGVECVVCGKFISARSGGPRSAHARKHVRDGKAREAIHSFTPFARYVYFTRNWRRGRRKAGL